MRFKALEAGKTAKRHALDAREKAMSEIQSIGIRPSRKASRSLTPVPEEIGKLLKIVNVVPPDVELPDISEGLLACSRDKQGSWLLHEIEKVFGDVPKLLLIYLWRGEAVLLGILDDDPAVSRATLDSLERREQDAKSAVADRAEMKKRDDWPKRLNEDGYSAGLKYTYLRDVRFMLRDIARQARGQSFYVGFFPETRLSYSLAGSLYVRSGRSYYQPPPIVEAFEGVEVDRIRECEVCRLLFWAGRLDQTACSTKCAKILRTRRWRENYQTKYKLNRIEKEEAKQKRTSKMDALNHGVKGASRARGTKVMGKRKGSHGNI